jgi:hypothetical protein
VKAVGLRGRNECDEQFCWRPGTAQQPSNDSKQIKIHADSQVAASRFHRTDRMAHRTGVMQRVRLIDSGKTGFEVRAYRPQVRRSVLVGERTSSMSKPRKNRRARSKCRSGLPKGAYRTPDGGYVTESRTVVGTGKNRYTLVVRAKRRAEPDLKRLARALVELAREELEANRKQQNG